MLGTLPRQNTDDGVVVVRLGDNDPAHLDGLRLVMDVMNRDPFGLQLKERPRDIAISPGMAILIYKGSCKQIRRLLQHYGLQRSPYTVLDDVLSLRHTYFMLTRRLLEERPDLKTLRAGTSRNLFLGNDLVRWNVHLGGTYGFTVAVRPTRSDLGITRDTWIAVSHDSKCRFVFERDLCTQEFWLYVLLHEGNETSTRNFYVGQRPPSWSHSWVPSVVRLLEHVGMLLLADGVKKQATVSTSVYSTIPLGIEFEDGVIQKMCRAMPGKAFWAVFWHHAANRMVYGMI